jgi:hypothetical protein
LSLGLSSGSGAGLESLKPAPETQNHTRLKIKLHKYPSSLSQYALFYSNSNHLDWKIKILGSKKVTKIGEI